MPAGPGISCPAGASGHGEPGRDQPRRRRSASVAEPTEVSTAITRPARWCCGRRPSRPPTRSASQIWEYSRTNSGANRISWALRGRGRSTSKTAFTRPGPAVSTTTWSASAIASSRSWVTKITAGRVCSHSPSSSPDMMARVCTSSAENGSSISSTRGSLIRLCARATRLRMPPDSWCGYRSSKPARPTRRSQSRAAALAGPRRWPRNRGPAATLSSTLFHGNTASFWNMKPTPGVIPDTGRPATSAAPGGGPFQAGHQGQRGGLAASGRADHGAELARFDDQVEVGEGGVAAAPGRAELLGHATQFDGRLVGGAHQHGLLCSGEAEACRSLRSRNMVALVVLPNPRYW